MDSEVKLDSARQDAPAGPDTHSSRDQPSGLKGALTPAHSAVGPTGGLFEKTVELLQRFEDTPGDSFKERCASMPAKLLPQFVANARAYASTALRARPAPDVSCLAPVSHT